MPHYKPFYRSNHGNAGSILLYFLIQKNKQTNKKQKQKLKKKQTNKQTNKQTKNPVTYTYRKRVLY